MTALLETIGLRKAFGAVIAANDETTVSKASISIDNVTAGEQDDFADFVIRLDAPTTAPVTVFYQTIPSTAGGNDYVSDSGTLTFAAGETSQTIAVSVLGDTVAEPNETLTLALSEASGATIAQGSATGTIVNDDGVAAQPTLSIVDTSCVRVIP